MKLRILFASVLLSAVALLAPAMAAAQGVSHFNTLKWTPSTSVGVTSQKVYRGTSASGPFTLIATIPDGTTSTFQDTNTTKGVIRFYAVTALVGTDESLLSAAASGGADVGTNVNPQTGLTVGGT